MSRIQKLLSKADRDGTANRLTWPPGDARDRRGRAAAVPRSWQSESPTAASDDWQSDTAAVVTSHEPRTETTPPALESELDFETLPARSVIGARPHRLLVTALDPSSDAAEHYRSLRTRIAQLDGDHVRRVMAVTSPMRGDGKTVTVGNLALTMAQEFERRTLLVDADLRNPGIHTLLGIAREPGLVDVLNGDARLEEALVSLPGHRLLILPAGSAHGQQAELLGSNQMRRLLELLRPQFDRILLDTTSAHTSDTGALEPFVDGLLLVVRAGQTTRPAIERALGTIPPPKLMGLILNDSRNLDNSSAA